jgi:hypothetical protein
MNKTILCDSLIYLTSHMTKAQPNICLDTPLAAANLCALATKTHDRIKAAKTKKARLKPAAP